MNYEVTQKIPIRLLSISADEAIEKGSFHLLLATWLKPGVFNTGIKIREYLRLTISIEHNLVNGASAVRFVTRLKQRIEGNYYN